MSSNKPRFGKRFEHVLCRTIACCCTAVVGCLILITSCYRGENNGLARDFSSFALACPGSVYRLAFSPDGKFIAFGLLSGDIVIADWPAKQTYPPLKGHNAEVKVLCFSTDGAKLFSAGMDCTVRVWDVADKKAIAEIANEGWVLAGSYLDGLKTRGFCYAGGNVDRPSLMLLKDDLRQPEVLIKELKSQARVIAPSAQRKRVVVRLDLGPIYEYDIDEGLSKHKLLETSAGPALVKSSPDGAWVALGAFLVGVDDNLSPACVKLLKADDQVEYMQVRTTNELGICDVAFSPDGHLFAVVSAMQRNVNKSTPSEIKVYNLATKEVVFSQTDSCSLIRVLFAPTGRTLVAAGQRDFLTGIVKVWDLDALLPGNLGK